MNFRLIALAPLISLAGLTLGCEVADQVEPTAAVPPATSMVSESAGESGTLVPREQLHIGSGTPGQPPGVDLDPNGTSHIWWMFETPKSDWVVTCSVGCGGHGGDDYYADDWTRTGAGGLTKEQRTYGQTIYAGISGTVIAMANHGGYANDLIIYGPDARFALKNAHLSEITVATG